MIDLVLLNEGKVAAEGTLGELRKLANLEEGGLRRSFLRSHSFHQLTSKELRELFASRAFWLMLLIAGILVGHAFITAVNTYAEMSGSGGAPAALPQALTPLDGILVPTWGAYDLAATLLFPFVAIRLIAAEKESGGLKLLLQLPGSLASKLTAKGLALIVGWLIAWIPGLVAIILWKAYGGHLHSSETLNLLVGHLLRGFLSAGLAVAAAGLAESASSAAIITSGLRLAHGRWTLSQLVVVVGCSNLRVTHQLLRYDRSNKVRSNSALWQ